MATAPTEPTPTPAALLKLRGVNAWQVVVGEWASRVQFLNLYHPFQVDVVLVAPETMPHAEEASKNAIKQLAVSCNNGWFACTLRVAMTVLEATMSPLSAGQESCNDTSDVDSASTPQCSPSLAAAPMEAAPNVDTAMDETDGASPAAGSDTVMGDTRGNCEVDQALWTHVEPCSTREASKATDLRAALTAKLGKSMANQLLSKTQATVAKDAQGRNNRVLRANGILLKLKAPGR